MTAKITSKDVLLYLNYLGYNNINAQQLKEFIQDLKKLIKYEERKKSKENIYTGSVHIPDGTSDYVPTKHGKPNNQVEEPDIFTILHSHGTFASEAKAVCKKENVISLQIKKSKCHHHCAQQDKENVQPKSVANKDNGQPEDMENQTGNLQVSEKTSKVNSGLGSKKSCSLRRKSSFLRPPVQVSNKSDPVALYHYYKAGWERYPVPGEDQRTELRWAIREKMLSGPRVSRT